MLSQAFSKREASVSKGSHQAGVMRGYGQ